MTAATQDLQKQTFALQNVSHIPVPRKQQHAHTTTVNCSAFDNRSPGITLEPSTCSSMHAIGHRQVMTAHSRDNSIMHIIFLYHNAIALLYSVFSFSLTGILFWNYSRLGSLPK